MKTNACGLHLSPDRSCLQAAEPDKPLKTSACELIKHPADFDGKLVAVRAIVESGVSDLPAAVTDESCGAVVKFFMPDDPEFAKLVKSRGFKKLIKEVKRNPVVVATVTGHFKRIGTEAKGEYG